MTASIDIAGLYRDHGPHVLRRARAILGDEQDAQDALHEVFLQAMGALPRFRGESSLTTWFYRLTTNYCLNVLRNSRTRLRLLASRAPTPEMGPAGAESSAILRDLLRRVPEPLCATAVAFYVDEMTQDEAAEHLGISRRTVGYRLEAFRDAARALAGERGPEAQGVKP